MNDSNSPSSNARPERPAWNTGKLTLPKAAATARTRLADPSQAATGKAHTRDLALFNLAIDSKLRGCDLVALRVDDVAPNGYAVDRANVRQRKTGRPVRFELTEVTRQAVDDYLAGQWSERRAVLAPRPPSHVGAPELGRQLPSPPMVSAPYCRNLMS